MTCEEGGEERSGLYIYMCGLTRMCSRFGDG